MDRRKKMKEDPVVQEVRTARAKLWKEAGESIEGLSRLVKERAAAIRKEKSTKKKRN